MGGQRPCRYVQISPEVHRNRGSGVPSNFPMPQAFVRMLLGSEADLQEQTCRSMGKLPSLKVNKVLGRGKVFYFA